MHVNPKLYAVEKDGTLNRVSSAIPAGTDIQTAKSTMEQDGWNCEEIACENGGTFLMCVYSRKEDVLVTYTTEVRLYYAQGNVVDVEVKEYGTGL